MGMIEIEKLLLDQCFLYLWQTLSTIQLLIRSTYKNYSRGAMWLKLFPGVALLMPESMVLLSYENNSSDMKKTINGTG